VGDLESAERLLRLPGTDTGCARLLADWIVRIEAQAAAALTLEPLDLQHLLTDDQRDRWQEALGALTLSLCLQVDEATTAGLRRRLVRSSTTYRDISEALAAPYGSTGRALLATREGIGAGEPVGDFVSGLWVSKDPDAHLKPHARG
jgi:hypothetical protein